MHYLITGGTRLIGSALRQQLITEGHHVIVLSRSPSAVEDSGGVGVKAI